MPDRRTAGAKRRFRLVKLAAAATLIAVAATGVAFAGGTERSALRDVQAAPDNDGKSTREATLSYLTNQGMSPRKARQRMANQDKALKAATRLRTRAPDHVRSVWLDDDGKLMVRALDELGAREAKSLGATPVLSTLTAKDFKSLERTRDTLAKDATKNPPDGMTSADFELDDSTGKVVARYFFKKPGGKVPETATKSGDVKATTEVGDISPLMDVRVAGATMQDMSTRGICTAAWAVDIADAGGGTPKNGVMTAGHCMGENPVGAKFRIDTTAAGDTPATGVLGVFGQKGDYGVLELGDGHRGETKMADGLHVVEAVQEPVKGAAVCMNGANNQESCGIIRKVNVSTTTHTGGDEDDWANYVLMNNMTRATVCAEEGDSGAPLHADFKEGTEPSAVAAIGIVSHGIKHPNPQDRRGAPVCGEKAGKQSETYATPLKSIDTEGKFHVRIQGG